VQGFTGSGFWSVADDGEIPVRYRLIMNSIDAGGGKEGMGIVSVFSHHVASNFQDGTLVSVLPDFKRETLPLSLVRGAGEYLPLKLRAFLDFVTPRLKARLAGKIR
jgi:DNA-binding transcriptional LysR family regulator